MDKFSVMFFLLFLREQRAELQPQCSSEQSYFNNKINHHICFFHSQKHPFLATCCALSAAFVAYVATPLRFSRL